MVTGKSLNHPCLTTLSVSLCLLPSSNGSVCHFCQIYYMRRYAGNARNFRQPSFGQDGYPRNAGRGMNMTQPAWHTRAANSSSSTVDMTESPEVSRSEMVAMLKMMQKKLDAADAEEAPSSSVSSNTRSSEKAKKRQKKST